MARYTKIERRIWNDSKFDKLSRDAKLIFFFLLTHPHLTALGAIRISITSMADELNWDIKAFREAFREVFKEGMVRYDEKARLVWLPNYLKHNSPESPNVVKTWANAADYLPECHLKSQIICHAKAFVDGLSKGFQEAFREVLQEDLVEDYREPYNSNSSSNSNNIGSFGSSLEPVRAERVDNSELISVFEHWAQTMHHPNAKFDEKRRKIIRAALKWGYTADQLKTAINGCALTPHNMGENDRGERYDGLHVILRNGDQIDRFIRHSHAPPVLPLTEDEKNKRELAAYFAKIEAEAETEKKHATL